MCKIVSGVAEAELGALFHNGKEDCPLRMALEEMGHPQLPATIETDNSAAASITSNSIKQKQSEAMEDGSTSVC
jgi:hypothetical protein